MMIKTRWALYTRELVCNVLRASSSKERWSFSLEAFTLLLGLEKCLHGLVGPADATSIHECHTMHRKALLKMLSPTFPHGSAHIENLTWVFTMSHGTEMSACPACLEVLEQGRGMIRFVNHIFEPWAFGVLSKETWTQGLNLVHLQHHSSSIATFVHHAKVKTRRNWIGLRWCPGVIGLNENNRKEFAPVRLIPYDILSVYLGCLACGAWWK